MHTNTSWHLNPNGRSLSHPFSAIVTARMCEGCRVIRKVDDSRMRSRREDVRRTVDFLDPLLRLPQRGSFVSKQAVIINLLGDPGCLTRFASVGLDLDRISKNHMMHPHVEHQDTGTTCSLDLCQIRPRCRGCSYRSCGSV